jgi:hypothetical protein
MNALTGAIVWILLLLSIVLTASVLYPSISAGAIEGVLGGGLAIGIVVGAWLLFRSRGASRTRVAPSAIQRRDWRMPPLTLLEKPALSRTSKVAMITMRSYLLLAVVLVVVKVVVVALAK